jgi:hypothetical protein
LAVLAICDVGQPPSRAVNAADIQIQQSAHSFSWCDTRADGQYCCHATTYACIVTALTWPVDSRDPWKYQYYHYPLSRPVSNTPLASLTWPWVTSSALWFAGIGRDKPTPVKVEKQSTSAETEVYSMAGMSLGWYYLFAVIEPVCSSHIPQAQTLIFQLLMTAAALYILVLPGEYGKSILPDRYERVTALIGYAIRGQMVLGGLGSCMVEQYSIGRVRADVSGLILTSLVQFTMFPLIRSALRDDQDIARRLVSGMIAPLRSCGEPRFVRSVRDPFDDQCGRGIHTAPSIPQ